MSPENESAGALAEQPAGINLDNHIVTYNATTMDRAEFFYSVGFSIIPVPHKSKIAVIKWKQFQTSRATPEEFHAWFGNGNGPQNMAIVTGALSGIVVVDTDDADAESWAEQNLTYTPWQQKTSKGKHRFYRHPGGHIGNKARVRTPEGKFKLDIKADSGYVLAAGSVHPDGTIYRLEGDWNVRLEQVPFLDPSFIVENENKAPEPTQPTAHSNGRGSPLSVIERARRYLDTIPGAVSGSGGHDQTFHVACRLILGFGLSKEDAFPVFCEYNRRCKPAWSERELQHKLDSADQQQGERGYLRDKNQSQWKDVQIPEYREPAVETATETQGLTLDDFRAYMPMHSYICIPTRDLWPASSVNARIKVPNDDQKASAWLDANKSVEQMTWAPGEQMIIRDHLFLESERVKHVGCTCFNLYRPPQKMIGNSAEATMWLDHVYRIYPSDADHIIRWNAHRVQKPHEKINHALVLGGLQGIGKDTLLEPVKYAIGPWNFCEISPTHLLGRFNPFVKSVILRISEARDLGDVDRYSFYDHLKSYTAAPPDVLRCDEKNIREYSVLNVCGVVITTNHKTDGIYLPADDRRHYVAWSDSTRDDFPSNYWLDLYKWYAQGGHGHVAAYLQQLDISSFDPKAPPPKTDAFWAIVDANRAPEDAELNDALDVLHEPDVVTLEKLILHTSGAFSAWLSDRKNSRQIPHRMESIGYIPVRNPAAKDGLWKIGGKRQVVYGQRELTPRERFAAAGNLTGGGR